MGFLKKMQCPKCNSEKFEVIVIEIDIGVGIQEYPEYGICDDCGDVGLCNCCGAWEKKDGFHHADWCNERG